MTPERDLQRLNAFVDGELTPAERAEIARRLANDPSLARAHATLVQLKSCMQAMAAETAGIAAPVRRRSRRPLLAAAAAGLAAMAAVSLWSSRQGSAPSPSGGVILTPASLPAGIILPRLDAAGLTLTTVATDGVDDRPVVTASYVGPHGCRLDLRVRTTGHTMPDLVGTDRRTWTAGDLVYDMAGHGMPAWRFGLMVEVAQAQTRHGADPSGLQQRLREARAAAPPCAG